MEVHADQEIVGRLMEIMDRVQVNLEMAEAVEADAERNRRDDFAELQDKHNGMIQYVVGQIVTLDTLMATLRNRIAQAKDSFSVAEGKLNDYQTRAGDRASECKTDSEVWE